MQSISSGSESSSGLSSSFCFFSAASTRSSASITPSSYFALPPSLTKDTRSVTSSSLMNAPCTRMALLAPLGSKSISPRPSSFSAPPMPRIVRLSTCEATAKAMREGTLALIRPVMTSTDGRCVAMTR